MGIPEDFLFSQGSLQDYVDCRRRFQLRYLRRVSWPAIQVEPALENERHLQRGAAFHRMIQQHLLGVPAERLSALLSDPAYGEDLRRWWESYLQHGQDLLGLRAEAGLRLHPEISLSAQLGGYRLVAKYDLILLLPEDRAVIFDWKTYRRLPRRAWLEARLQTRVYPYLLVEAGAALNQGRPLPPDQLEMIYWFADHPEAPERYPYSAARYAADEAYLRGLVDEIDALPEDRFELTPDLDKCRFCTYRSYCDRGGAAGSLSEFDRGLEDLERDAQAAVSLDIDFDQVGEIEF